MERLFFAFKVEAPWQETYPEGRMIDADGRHMTIAFLGDADLDGLLEKLKSFPPPTFQLGATGHFDDVLFLPPSHPKVVAWHANLGLKVNFFALYRRELSKWLDENGFTPKGLHQEWLPHVSICRAPFDKIAWQQQFRPLPFICSELHLYESVGGLHYKSRWNFSLVPPFEEFSHRADIAFKIRGKNTAELLEHARAALAFRYVAIGQFFRESPNFESLESIVADLNDSISRADAEIGCPLKSVSHHGEIQEKPDGFLEWEMIVDV